MGLVLFGFLVFPKVFRQPNKPSGKPTILKKTKGKKNKPLGKPKNKEFKGFRPTLGYGFGLVWLFGFPEGVLFLPVFSLSPPLPLCFPLARSVPVLLVFGYGFGLVWFCLFGFVCFPQGWV